MKEKLVLSLSSVEVEPIVEVEPVYVKIVAHSDKGCTVQYVTSITMIGRCYICGAENSNLLWRHWKYASRKPNRTMGARIQIQVVYMLSYIGKIQVVKNASNPMEKETFSP